MASTAGPFPIFYTPDVHNLYVKQKHEFHFNQKSDNEFLMFLLDTAVRVISIVQHLAPVIEAVSDANSDMEDMEDLFPIDEPNPANLSGSMEVDMMPEKSRPLLPEVEIAELAISSHLSMSRTSKNSEPVKITASSLPHSLTALPAKTTFSSNDTVQKTNVSSHASQSEPAFQSTSALPSTSELYPKSETHSPALQSTANAPMPQNNSSQSVLNATSCSSVVYQESSVYEPLVPIIPVNQLPTLAQSSVNLPTSLPSDRQPIARAPSAEVVKTEQPIHEVIEIKNEMEEPLNQTSPAELIPHETLQHLLSSMPGTEDRSGLQNFVPTATPSSLPPSFLDRGSNNPLSMVGSLNPGSSAALHTSALSEMKSIIDGGLNSSSLKGQANPIERETHLECPVCRQTFTGPPQQRRRNFKAHWKTIHLMIRDFKCDVCGKLFGRKHHLSSHKSRYEHF